MFAARLLCLRKPTWQRTSVDFAFVPQTDSCAAAIAVRRTGFEGSERRDRTDDFFCRHNGTRVIRDVEVQLSVHHLVQVVGEAVLGELGREAAPREYRGACFTCAGAGSLAGIEDPARVDRADLRGERK